MLQITIVHFEDETAGVETIQDDSSILATYNKVEDKIDLDVCVPFIGQDILIKHIFPKEEDSYQSIAELQGVDIDEAQIKFIKFCVKSKMPLVKE